MLKLIKLFDISLLSLLCIKYNIVIAWVIFDTL